MNPLLKLFEEDASKDDRGDDPKPCRPIVKGDHLEKERRYNEECKRERKIIPIHMEDEGTGTRHIAHASIDQHNFVFELVREQKL